MPGIRLFDAFIDLERHSKIDGKPRGQGESACGMCGNVVPSWFRRTLLTPCDQKAVRNWLGVFDAPVLCFVCSADAQFYPDGHETIDPVVFWRAHEYLRVARAARGSSSERTLQVVAAELDAWVERVLRRHAVYRKRVYWGAWNYSPLSRVERRSPLEILGSESVSAYYELALQYAEKVNKVYCDAREIVEAIDLQLVERGVLRRLPNGMVDYER